jgi:CRP/FNR family cyclic AMP-dependent transcriptional regulator
MKKILIIEDNKDVRENTEEILQLSGYDVTVAENGKKGVDAALVTIPDLIVCDIMMPELDGFGVLHLLNRNLKTAHIPFIFLTAKTERADIRKGMEMGADDFITKPFDDIELLNAIEARLKKTEKLQDAMAAGTAIQSFNELIKSGNISLTSSEREVIKCKKKQTIYSIGQRPSSLYYVSKGKLKTFKMNDDGKELITAVYNEGDFMGYHALLEETTYKDQAEALEDAELMLIPKVDFLKLMSSDLQVIQRFVKLLTRNVLEHEEQMLNLAYNSLRKRVANGLVNLYDKFKKDKSDAPLIEFTREDLAQYIGTATESLIRTLSDFKGEKLIEIREGKIAIINEARLRTMLN